MDKGLPSLGFGAPICELGIMRIPSSRVIVRMEWDEAQSTQQGPVHVICQEAAAASSQDFGALGSGLDWSLMSTLPPCCVIGQVVCLLCLVVFVFLSFSLVCNKGLVMAPSSWVRCTE